jgi:pilus assembly protein CpaB
MDRGTRTLIVLAVAVLAAGAASYGVYTAIRSIPERRVEIATRNAVVAKTQLAVGTRITSDLVKVVPWPEKAPLKGGFADIAEVVERGLITAVGENEPITESKLASKEAGAGLPPTITPGMRAMAVRVNDIIGVAGFVLAGSRVDVLTVIQQQNQQDPMSRVVVSNVEVLAANTRYDQEEARQGEAIRSTVVTLMLSPSDAERIALAQTEGRLMLTLRNPLDVEPTQTAGVRKAALFGAAPAPVKAAVTRRAPAPAPPAPTPVIAPPYMVETIRAAKRNRERLLGD